jgi:hypothetical protein
MCPADFFLLLSLFLFFFFFSHSKLTQIDPNNTQTGVDEMKVEFSKRLGEMEKKMAILKREKDELKKQLDSKETQEQSQTLQQTNIQTQTQTQTQQHSNVMQEKDKEIALLREEGKTKKI